MSKSYSFILFATLLIGIFIGWTLESDKKCPEIAGTTIEYVEVPVVKDSLIYKPVIIPKWQKVNEDSIYEAAKLYWQMLYDVGTPVDYMATIDTNLTDKDSLLTGSVSFVSRIAIDPNGYFKTDLKVREKIITNNYVKTEEVYMPRRLSFGVGVTASLTDPVEAKVLGNITYKPIDTKWFEMPITTEVQYGDKLEYFFRAEGRIKF